MIPTTLILSLFAVALVFLFWAILNQPPVPELVLLNTLSPEKGETPLSILDKLRTNYNTLTLSEVERELSWLERRGLVRHSDTDFDLGRMTFYFRKDDPEIPPFDPNMMLLASGSPFAPSV